jgi:hypothetical protein
VYAAATALGWWLSSTVITRGQKGTIMEILIVAILAIVGFGLFRYMRTRSAH